MKITEAFARGCAMDLAEAITNAEHASKRLWRLLDPEQNGAGLTIPYPPDAGWKNALEQSATSAAIEVSALLGRLTMLRQEIAGSEVAK